VLAGTATVTNRRLVEACWRLGTPAHLLRPQDAEERLGPGDVVLARLDVLPTVDGVEPGLETLCRLSARGVRVLNGAAALLAAHDKASTARHLAREGIPHPRTFHLRPGVALPRTLTPVVLKPRFGSWGRDVYLCRSREELLDRMHRIRYRSWFRRQGAILQQVMPVAGNDLRVLVACGRVVGAIARVAPAGEWRTSVALGATRHPLNPSPRARDLATAAAAAVGGHLVGVDLLPLARGGYVVLEVNAAPDFTETYDLGGDVFEQVVRRLRLLPNIRPTGGRSRLGHVDGTGRRAAGTALRRLTSGRT
jgi:RimK family alpha-L-glutamate ligase